MFYQLQYLRKHCFVKPIFFILFISKKFFFIFFIFLKFLFLFFVFFNLFVVILFVLFHFLHLFLHLFVLLYCSLLLFSCFLKYLGNILQSFLSHSQYNYNYNYNSTKVLNSIFDWDSLSVLNIVTFWKNMKNHLEEKRNGFHHQDNSDKFNVCYLIYLIIWCNSNSIHYSLFLKQIFNFSTLNSEFLHQQNNSTKRKI